MSKSKPVYVAGFEGHNKTKGKTRVNLHISPDLQFSQRETIRLAGVSKMTINKVSYVNTWNSLAMEAIPLTNKAGDNMRFRYLSRRQ
ncbi:hypothetical protein L8S23_22615 [Enterobacter bugandensis]|uniref:hypothetical protein n=1 Tax=Enterobacter bugandensis TaxID=881260 RepID=UPI0020058AC7|nr:hypothetical protein [Enterobacter bugandensis]MCK6879970.1 hypothetical protein [Enterobacter bugandensis]